MPELFCSLRNCIRKDEVQGDSESQTPLPVIFSHLYCQPPSKNLDLFKKHIPGFIIPYSTVDCFCKFMTKYIEKVISGIAVMIQEVFGNHFVLIKSVHIRQSQDMKKQQLSQIARSFSECKPDSASESVCDYVENLEKQCSIRIDAIKIAQKIIQKYKLENKSLKEENMRLKQVVEESREKEQKRGEKPLAKCQCTSLQVSERVRSLLEHNLRYEKSISFFQRELRNTNIQLETFKQKEMKQKQKKQNSYSRNTEGQVKEQWLKEKLLEKDEEVLKLMRKINYLEERYKSDFYQEPRNKTTHYLPTMPTESTFDPLLSRKFNNSIQTMEA